MKISLLALFLTVSSHLLLSDLVFSQWTSSGYLNASGEEKRISMVDSNIVWACGGSGTNVKVWRTIDGGVNWLLVNTSGLPYWLYALYAKDSLTAFAGDAGGTGFTGGNARIFKTTNGGINWLLIDSTGGTYGWISGIVFSRTNPNFGFIISDPPDGPGEPYYYAVTHDGGQSWTSDFIPGIYNTFTLGDGAFCVDSLFYGFLIIKSSYNDSTRVYLTTDGGLSWQVMSTSPTFGSPLGGTCDFNDDKNKGIFVVGNMLPQIAKTANGGLNWNIVNTGISASGFSNVKFISGTNIVFLSAMHSTSGNYIYRSNNNGESWFPQSTASNMNYIIDASFIRNESVIKGFVITIYGYVFKTSQDTVPIGINKTSEMIPSQFNLYQNYPNPFNPVTKIKFDVPPINASMNGIKGVMVKLVVYDILGRLIHVLKEDQLINPGTYEVEWDASNYPSGVYCYRLTAGDYSETRKMIFIK